jgi:hypothetical protein
VTLRVYDPDPLDNIAFCPKGSTNPKCNGVVTHGVTFVAKAESANALPGGTFDGPISDALAPDLTIIGAPAVAPTTIVAGDDLTITGSTLRNTGSSPAIARGGFDTGYFLSNDASVTPADLMVGTITTPSLAPTDPPVSLDRVVTTPADDIELVFLPPGQYRFGLVTDMNGVIAESNEGNNTAVGAATITVVPRPQITTTTLPDAQVGSTYSQALAATGGVGTLTWSWAPAVCPIGTECFFTQALPPGLSLSPTGIISGTPTATGGYGVVVSVIDSAPGAASSPRHRADQFFILQVLTPLIVTFTTQPPEAMTDGSAFTVGVLVRDVTGASIPGALVSLQLADNEEGATLSPVAPTATSNADGNAQFTNIRVLGAGTYRLRAVVNQVGFAPSEGFSNVFTIFPATSFVGPVGGNGGTPFGPFTCAPGSMASALRGRAGDDIDRTELWCSNIDGTFVGAPAFVAGVGAATGADYGTTLSCPSGSVITGLHGRAGTVVWGGTVVDTLGVTCTNLASGAIQATPEVGNSAGAPVFTIGCPAGQHVVGIQGRQGALLDQIAIICQ